MTDRLQPEMSTRRGLLRALARSAKRHTREGANALGPRGLQGLLNPEEGLSEADPSLGGAATRPPRHPARRPERTATLDELLAVAHEEGLAHRDNDLRCLAMRSLRMTPADPANADAWILTNEAWIAAGDEVPLALINLTGTTAPTCELPPQGWLALFVEAGAVGSDVLPAHGVILDLPAAIPDTAEPVGLSPELVLPRRWHETVQALELDDTEAAAYERVRGCLQLLQGTESDDDGGSGIAYHRLLGYPNETTGSMPASCIRAVRTWSPAGEPASDLNHRALPSSEWRLLTQISIGEQRRAYVWIRRTDLSAGEFGELCAFVR